MTDFTGGEWRSLVDGSIVPAIPDSAVARWPYDDNEGSTARDTAGDNPATLNNNPTWVSGDWIGGYALDFDPTNAEYTTANVVGEISLGGSWGVYCTFRADGDGSGERIIWSQYDGTDSVALSYDGSNLRLQTFDGGASSYDDGVSVSVTTNTRHRAVCVSNEGTLSIYLNDGDEQTGSISNNINMPVSNQEFATAGNTDDGFYFSGVIDEPIAVDKVPSSQDITDDYRRQPWS